MIKSFVRAFAVAVSIALACVSTQAADGGAKRALLADVHAQKSVDCAGCHAEVPPAKAVGSAKCAQCHGSQEAVAARTEKVEPNPHASHQGAEACESCHHAHKASEDSCGRCHAWGYRTP